VLEGVQQGLGANAMRLVGKGGQHRPGDSVDEQFESGRLLLRLLASERAKCRFEAIRNEDFHAQVLDSIAALDHQGVRPPSCRAGDRRACPGWPVVCVCLSIAQGG
jgi:hypothetical protein